MALRTLEWLCEETLSSADLLRVRHGASRVLSNGWKLDLGALVVLSNSCRAHGGAYRLQRPVFELVALLASRRRHSGIAAEYIGITDLGPLPTCDAVEMSNMHLPGAARDRASAEALWARLAKSGVARMPSAREVEAPLVYRLQHPRGWNLRHHYGQFAHTARKDRYQIET
ncbi:unnamed protein product [Symbiodinium microadriaticum]|nr:unnamed protein product [Symbiodinium microadriaticum]